MFKNSPSAFLCAGLLCCAFVSGQDDGQICTSDSRTFTAKVDLYASELGYFYFEECGDMVNPTIAMEVGETYTFIQHDKSNAMHPLGFAYFPDGAHSDKDELEPGISQTSSSCVDTLSCPAPMYHLNEEYLGTYSNLVDDALGLNVTQGEEDFGLDAYEPLFFHPIGDWVGYGNFSVKLKFDDENYDQDLFYFCHVHEFMSGRIKLTSNGEIINANDTPELGYKYDVPSNFDQECGTFGLDDFQLPHAECPNQFICNSGDASAGFQQYASCLNAMNCHMMVGMTVSASLQNEIATFIHGMVPHHQNAVNMAKALLKIEGAIDCDDITNEMSPDCQMERIAREIINSQNHQIQQMRRILLDKQLPMTEDCIVEINNGISESDANGDATSTNGGDDESEDGVTSSQEETTNGSTSSSGRAYGMLFLQSLAASVAIIPLVIM